MIGVDCFITFLAWCKSDAGSYALPILHSEGHVKYFILGFVKACDHLLLLGGDVLK